MKSKWLKSTFVIVMVLLFITPPCWAKTQAFCFVVGYSYKLKKAYCTPIFMVKVRNVSYSDTEYVTEVDLLQKMESQFLNHIASTGVNPDSFTMASRGAFKTRVYAQQGLAKEKANFAKKSFEVLDLKTFQFKK